MYVVCLAENGTGASEQARDDAVGTFEMFKYASDDGDRRQWR